VWQLQPCRNVGLISQYFTAPTFLDDMHNVKLRFGTISAALLKQKVSSKCKREFKNVKRLIAKPKKELQLKANPLKRLK
jgi:hypothetical protein